MSKIPRVALSTIAAMACMALPPAQAAVPAGLSPDRRPPEAPAIKEFVRGDVWRAAALRGVSQPQPASVARFLDHQGAWYTPFARPGMPGRYDIRGMHSPVATTR